MREQTTVASPSAQEDYLKKGKFILQAMLMEVMLPRIGIGELDWGPQGYAAIFHEVYMTEGKRWWEQYQEGNQQRVLQEMQERMMGALRASIH